MNQPATDILNGPTLDQLCATLLAEKALLKARQSAVAEAEAALIAAVGARDEGSFSTACDGYKVTTTAPVRRTITTDGAKDLHQLMAKDLYDSLIEWKPSLSIKVYKDLEKYQPELFAQISRHVTSKPGKVAVRVEDIERGTVA